MVPFSLYSPIFTLTHKKDNVCIAAINAGMAFFFFAMHIVYEYLKVTGSIYRPGPPLFILGLLPGSCVPHGSPWDSFFLVKEMQDANVQQRNTFTAAQVLPLKEVSCVCLCAHWCNLSQSVAFCKYTAGGVDQVGLKIWACAFMWVATEIYHTCESKNWNRIKSQINWSALLLWNISGCTALVHKYNKTWTAA